MKLVHEALSYKILVSSGGFKLGLVLNFGALDRLEFRRVVLSSRKVAEDAEDAEDAEGAEKRAGGDRVVQ